MRRRDYIQAAGITAVTPLSGVASASEPDELVTFRSKVVEVDVSLPDDVDAVVPDMALSPPEVTDSGVFVSKSKNLIQSQNGGVLVFDQTGAIQQGRDVAEFTPGKARGRVMSGSPDGELGPARGGNGREGLPNGVRSRGKGLAVGRDAFRSNEAKRRTYRTAVQMARSGADARVDVDVSVSIRDHGVRDVYAHPTKHLIPLDSERGYMLSKAKERARRKGTSINEEISSERVERTVTEINGVNAILIEENYRANRDGRADLSAANNGGNH